MENKIQEFISQRCNDAVMCDEDYIKIEAEDNADATQAKAETVCYIQGARDMLKIMMILLK